MDKYGISRHAARCVLDGRTWGHVGGAKPIPAQRKLSQEQTEEIYRVFEGGVYRGMWTELANSYNVSRAYLNKMYKEWK